MPKNSTFTYKMCIFNAPYQLDYKIAFNVRFIRV